MIKVRWLLAIPVMLAATLLATTGVAQAATIRDRGEMFSKDAVLKAQTLLDKVENSSGVPIVIETIDAIPGLDRNTPPEKRRHAIDALALDRDQAIHDHGIYVLMSKRDHVISHVLVRQRFTDVLPISKRDAIRDAFVNEFKKDDGYDAGLLSGAQAIEKALHGVSIHSGGIPAHRGEVERVQHRAEGGKMPAGRSTLGTFLMILLGIFGVLIVLRLIGGIFQRPMGCHSWVQGWRWRARPGNWRRILRRARLWRARGRFLLERPGWLGRCARRQLVVRPVLRWPSQQLWLGGCRPRSRFHGGFGPGRRCDYRRRRRSGRWDIMG